MHIIQHDTAQMIEHYPQVPCIPTRYVNVRVLLIYNIVYFIFLCTAPFNDLAQVTSQH